MRRRRLLLIEDHAKTAASVTLFLESQGFEVAHAADGRTGLERASAERFDLLILDLALPRLDGREVCRELRRFSAVPILMLTALTAPEERVRGLELGADDYLGKPFLFAELLARVRAILRRTDPRDAAAERLAVGELTLDFGARRVEVAGEAKSLTPTEFDLFATLLKAPGRSFTREELVERVLGPDFDGDLRTIDTHVKNLRRKVESDPEAPRFIITVFGVGYRLALP